MKQTITHGVTACVPAEVMAALDRMSKPLDASWGPAGDGSATAAADARDMLTIRDYIMRNAGVMEDQRG